MLPNDSHIRQIATGNVLAFRQLHQALYSRLFYFVYRMTRDRELSEDMIQDSFIKYWENRTTFDNLKAVKVYLYAVLKNKVMNQLRDESNRQRILATIDFTEQTDESDYLMIAAEIADEVKRAVTALPPQSRLVIELSMAGKTVAEVATELNISPNTVKILKKSAYKTLRTRLSHLRVLLFYLFI